MVDYTPDFFLMENRDHRRHATSHWLTSAIKMWISSNLSEPKREAVIETALLIMIHATMVYVLW